MSNRELAIRIVDKMSEEQLAGFISMFEQFYHVKKNTDINAEKKMAFEKLEKMIRPISNLDEKKELAEYRDERYGA